jgi:hypothetical protein
MSLGSVADSEREEYVTVCGTIFKTTNYTRKVKAPAA